jgi:hypothetical protein
VNTEVILTDSTSLRLRQHSGEKIDNAIWVLDNVLTGSNRDSSGGLAPLRLAI